jgi:hypothetical protein
MAKGSKFIGYSLMWANQILRFFYSDSAIRLLRSLMYADE